MRHIFSAFAEGGGKHAQNIYCAGGRMCAKENTPHYPQKATRHQNNAFSSLKQRHLFTKNTPSFLKITAYFFQGNEQADYQQ